jgi:hypothetical protein
MNFETPVMLVLLWLFLFTSQKCVGLFTGRFHLVNCRIGSSNYGDFCRGTKLLLPAKFHDFWFSNLGDIEF